MTYYSLAISEQIYKKLVTVGKVLKRSLKWDQHGISSSIRLKVTSRNKVDCQKNRSEKKSQERFGGQSHPKTCSRSTNTCHGESEPSLMLGEPILVIKIKFWHLIVVFELHVISFIYCCVSFGEDSRPTMRPLWMNVFYEWMFLWMNVFMNDCFLWKKMPDFMVFKVSVTDRQTDRRTWPYIGRI